jgi:predicted MFS family arabinose efflux permease
MGLFGEFENIGVTVGPIIGGLVWAAAGISAAFYAYAIAAVGAAVVAAVTVGRRRTSAMHLPDVLVQDLESRR